MRLLTKRFALRPAALLGWTVSLGAPVALGAMLVHVGGFYPETGLSAALRTSGLVLASLPGAVLLLEARRSRRSRDGGNEHSHAGAGARREWT